MAALHLAVAALLVGAATGQNIESKLSNLMVESAGKDTEKVINAEKVEKDSEVVVNAEKAEKDAEKVIDAESAFSHAKKEASKGAVLRGAAKKEAAEKDEVSAHVYVINRDDRKDRCMCMSLQLFGTKKYQVSRFSAVTPKEVDDVCPNMADVEEHRGGKDAKSLLCSNYKVLGRAQEEKKHDFIVVLEDDAYIHDKPQFWQELKVFLNGPCQDFDYVSVDPFFQVNGKEWQPFRAKPKSRVCKTTELYPLRGMGTHMQIYRRAAINKIKALFEKDTSENLVPLDWLFRQNSNETQKIRARTWAPSVVQQLKMAKLFGNEVKSKVCRADQTGRANIKHTEDKLKDHLDELAPEEKGEASTEEAKQESGPLSFRQKLGAFPCYPGEAMLRVPGGQGV